LVDGSDVRVHVVGSRILATQIICEATDYRYSVRQGAEQPSFVAIELDAQAGERCVSLALQLGLAIAGIDLRVSPRRSYCFEVNPSPVFTYYESDGGEIAAAVADWLVCESRAGWTE
jgi:glutathione synthase/RimK-type ligase-like ATP-grasp enzyme